MICFIYATFWNDEFLNLLYRPNASVKSPSTTWPTSTVWSTNPWRCFPDTRIWMPRSCLWWRTTWSLSDPRTTRQPLCSGWTRSMRRRWLMDTPMTFSRESRVSLKETLKGVENYFKRFQLISLASFIYFWGFPLKMHLYWQTHFKVMEM